MKKLIVIVCIALVIGGWFLSKSEFVGGITKNDAATNYLGALASSSVSVARTSTLIVASNGARTYGICSNVGRQTVWLGFAGAASQSWGLPLLPSTSYEFANQRNLYTGAVYGIVASISQSNTVRVNCYVQN